MKTGITMKKFFTILAVLFFTASMSAQQGQTTGTPAKDRATKTVHKMKEALQLTDVQEKEVYNLMVAHFGEIEKIKNDKARPEGEAKRAMQAQRDVTQREMAKILTPGQMQQYREMQKKDKH
ncbi:MAG: hypothetical protein FD123_3729 [Bacteroidetes bacterium]|nr:MAG: hypothetical protein FD123_3729 [Bacteroidota bacterium]